MSWATQTFPVLYFVSCLTNTFGTGLGGYNAVQNTERANNLLLGALKQFPIDYIFNVVYRLKEVGFESQDAA